MFSRQHTTLFVTLCYGPIYASSISIISCSDVPWRTAKNRMVMERSLKPHWDWYLARTNYTSRIFLYTRMSSDATEYFWTFVAPKQCNIQWWELYGLVGKSLTFCMYFIARLWPHILYFSCIFSIIWPNLCHDDLDGKVLHLQNSRRSLSR